MNILNKITKKEPKVSIIIRTKNEEKWISHCLKSLLNQDHKNIEIISFEPSTSNLRVLSRNISINKLEKKIKICQIPVGNNKNKFLTMKESAFMEGSALHAFGGNYNYEGKKFLSNNKSYENE